MKDFFSKLFSENSDVSMMRLMAFMALLCAIGLAWTGKLGYEAFLATAFTGKVLQKFTEIKTPDKNLNNQNSSQNQKVDNPDA